MKGDAVPLLVSAVTWHFALHPILWGSHTTWHTDRDHHPPLHSIFLRLWTTTMRKHYLEICWPVVLLQVCCDHHHSAHTRKVRAK